jgi:DNA invertase Pin-like site-specific DNA recombinase
MAAERPAPTLCAIYTRKSSEEGLEQEFNSLDAQREACEAYILSQRHEGWRALRTRYDDGGYSGGSAERPALKRLLADIEAGKINTVVVYKVDRLTRSLADFAKIIETFDKYTVSFVSITQQFNTTTSMGRLTLNVLLSFAQFEREVTGERIRDKIAASKRKGMWMGGMVPFGYAARGRKLIVVPVEAKRARWLYRRYLALGCVRKLKADLDRRGFKSKMRISATRRKYGGAGYSRGALYNILQNPIYLGEVHHKGQIYPGEHEAIVPRGLWDKVQAKLRANNQARRNGLNAKSPSLLAGLLYDDRGHRFTPSHAVKNGKRYRYYVSQAAIQGLAQGAAPRRIPAHEIETLVSDRVKSFLGAPEDLLKAFRSTHPSRDLRAILAAGRSRVKGWGAYTSAEQRELLHSITHRIVVGESKVEILIRKRGLSAALLGRPAAGIGDAVGLLRLTIGITLARAGSEVRLVVPSGQNQTGRPSPVLIKAVARARDWYEKLVSGGFQGSAAVARSERVTVRYVRRILEGAFLAPDIVERVLEGRQPPGFSVETFRRGLPMNWQEQRVRLGIAPNE